jgi:hypothetical protein
MKASSYQIVQLFSEMILFHLLDLGLPVSLIFLINMIDKAILIFKLIRLVKTRQLTIHFEQALNDTEDIKIDKIPQS